MRLKTWQREPPQFAGNSQTSQALPGGRVIRQLKSRKKSATSFIPPFRIKTRYNGTVWQASIEPGRCVYPNGFWSFNDHRHTPTLSWTSLTGAFNYVQAVGTWSHMVGPALTLTDSNSDTVSIYPWTFYLTSPSMEVTTTNESGMQSPDATYNTVEEIWRIGVVEVAAGAVNDEDAAVTVTQDFEGVLALSTIVVYSDQDAGGTPPDISDYILNGTAVT